MDDEGDRTHVVTRVDVPQDADPAPVVIVLPDRSGRCTVRVLDVDGVGVAGAKVTVKSGPPVIGTVAKGVTGSDGSLVLSGLPTDVATVQVLPSGSVLHAREIGHAELAGGEVVFRLEAGEIAGTALRADGTPARVRVALDREIGRIDGAGGPRRDRRGGAIPLPSSPEGRVRTARRR